VVTISDMDKSYREGVVLFSVNVCFAVFYFGKYVIISMKLTGVFCRVNRKVFSFAVFYLATPPLTSIYERR